MHGHGKEAAACLCVSPSALDPSTTFAIHCTVSHISLDRKRGT
jgi:hypothetical protein